MHHFVLRESWVKEVPDYKPRLLIMNKYCLCLQWTYYLIGISRAFYFAMGRCDLEGECEEGTTMDDVEKARSDLKMQGCLK